MSYIDFLKSKMVIAPETGFDIDESEINPALLPHQLAPVVEWTRGNIEVVRGLQRLLGDVRKVERSTQNRFYTPRTNILKEG